MQPNGYYRLCLRNELAERSGRNPRYSLRAFAKALGIDAAGLSRILSGERVPSASAAESLCARLDLAPGDRKRFLASVMTARKQRKLRKYASEPEASETGAQARELTADAFRLISDWYHYAILELTFTPSFKNDPKWIASQLGISAIEAKLAVSRLLSLELLQVDEKTGKLFKTDHQLTTAGKNLTTSAHRRRQKQVLEKAIHSLENDGIEERDTTALCMSIDPKKIPEAKRRIQEFKRGLCEFLEGGDRLQVYELAISLFPTQKRST